MLDEKYKCNMLHDQSQSKKLESWIELLALLMCPTQTYCLSQIWPVGFSSPSHTQTHIHRGERINKKARKRETRGRGKQQAKARLAVTSEVLWE